MEKVNKVKEANKVKKVFIVFKTHFDIGYTHLAKELLEWYCDGMIHDVAEVCKATSGNPSGRRYVWTVPAWPLKKIVESVQDAPLRGTVEKLIMDGQLVWHGLPFTTHTEFCGLEELIRGLNIAGELSKRYGRWTSDAKMTDVPGHTWILPSILSKAGIKFIHLGSNFCATPPDVPRLFFWEGPDGSRVLTYYSKGDYGTDLVPPGDWDYPYWLAMLQTLDNLGAQDTSYLDGLFERAEKELPEVEVSIGSLEDFANAILESGCEIPVIRGDLADTWIRGVGSAPVGASLIRAQRQVLTTLECMTSLWDIHRNYESSDAKDKDKKAVAESYEKMLLFGEHTWSMDTKVTILPERKYGAPWIGFKFWENGMYDKELFDRLRMEDPGYLKLQESWDEQMDYLKDAGRNIEYLRNSLLQGLAESVDLSGEKILVAGSLGWNTIQTIILDDIIKDTAGVKHLVSAGSNEKIPVYINYDGKLAVDIWSPKLGYAAYSICRVTQTEEIQGESAYITSVSESTASTTESVTSISETSALKSESIVSVSETTASILESTVLIPESFSSESELIASIANTLGILENQFFTLELDSMTGCITKLYQKECDKNWVDGDSEFGFGQYVYDIYGSRELKEYLCDYCYVLRDWGVNDYGKAGYPKDQQHMRFVPVNFTIQADNGLNWGKLVLTAQIQDESNRRFGNASEIRMTVVLYKERNYVDISYELSGKMSTPLIESGHFVFPLAIDKPRYAINKTGSVVDPETEILGGCNKDLHCLEKWVDISNEQHGMAVISLDAPLFSFCEPGVLKYDKNFKIEKPTLLMQAFNNGWGTNFPQWIGGDLQFRYRLYPHKGDWKSGEVWKKGEETFKMPLAAYANCCKTDKQIPRVLDLFAQSMNGFSILAFKPSDQGREYILRIIDVMGVARSEEIKIILPVTEIRMCDILEREIAVVEVDSDNGIQSFQVNTAPFEIHSFIIKI